MTANILTQPRLKELLYYNPDTGIFSWKISPAYHIKIGAIAGTRCSGYIRIRVDKKNYKAHRLAFLYMDGKWPQGQVDHGDHIRHNNKWGNLCSGTHQENQKNASMRKDNTSGITGVHWCKRDKRWTAKIRNNTILNNLGSFTDKFEAICARMSANNKYGYHKNHGVKHE